LPVPILVENEHLQIWRLLTALLAFLELKRSLLHIVYVLNKQRKPRNILMQVCLKYLGDVIGSFLAIDARMGCVLKRGVLQKNQALLAGPLFFPWACMQANSNYHRFAIYSSRIYSFSAYAPIISAREWNLQRQAIILFSSIS
jgi:hypothetical protein